MHGAATMPIVNPITNAPNAPLVDWVLLVAIRFSDSGSLNSYTPNIDSDNATINPASTISTIEFCNSAPNKPPDFAAITPSNEYVRAIPRTYIEALKNVLLILAFP